MANDDFCCTERSVRSVLCGVAVELAQEVTGEIRPALKLVRCRCRYLWGRATPGDPAVPAMISPSQGFLLGQRAAMRSNRWPLSLVLLDLDHTRAWSSSHDAARCCLSVPGNDGDVTSTDPRAYVRIAGLVRQGIADGRWQPGQPVPSITTLSQDYGVARQTAAKALRLLEDEGLVSRVPGLGYYVC